LLIDEGIIVNDGDADDTLTSISVGYAEGNGFKKLVKIPVNDFLRHTLIVGSTGSGKSTTAAVIATQLTAHGHVVIIDWNDEYPDIIGDPSIRSLVVGEDFKIPTKIADIEDLVEIVTEVLELTDAQSYLLYKCLDEVQDVSNLGLVGLIDLLESMPIESKWMVETKSALLRRLKMIYNTRTKNLYDTRSVVNNVSFINNEGKLHVISLRSLRDIKLRRLAVLILIKVIEIAKKLNKVVDNIFIVIDEAHNVINVGLMNRLIAEVRKLGIGFIVVTQSPQLIGNNVLMNCNMKVIHSIKSSTDADILIKSLGINELRNVISRLDVGEAIIDSPSLSDVIRVRVERGFIISRKQF